MAGRVIDGGLWATGRGCTYDVEEEHLGGADLLLAVALWQQAAGGHGRAHLIWALARLLLLTHVLAQVPALVLLQLWQRGQAIGQELCQRGRAVGRRTLAAAAPIVGNGCLGMQLLAMWWGPPAARSMGAVIWMGLHHILLMQAAALTHAPTAADDKCDPVDSRGDDAGERRRWRRWRQRTRLRRKTYPLPIRRQRWEWLRFTTTLLLAVAAAAVAPTVTMAIASGTTDEVGALMDHIVDTLTLTRAALTDASAVTMALDRAVVGGATAATGATVIVHSTV